MKIKELRKKLGIKQKELAQKLNILPTTLYKYEKGINSPSVEMLISIADFFGVSIDSLVGRESDNLDLKFLSDKKQNIIKRILTLTPEEDIAVKGYLDKLFEDRK